MYLTNEAELGLELGASISPEVVSEQKRVLVKVRPLQ